MKTRTSNNNNMQGILFMILHTLSLSVLYAVVKELTQDLNSNLIVFLYKFTILIGILPWCFIEGISTLKSNRMGLHLSRGFLSIMGSLCMFYAIKHIGLSDVTAVAYLEQIILLVIGIFYFKEKATYTKFAVIVLSLIGAIIVIRPDLFEKGILLEKEISSHYIFVFLAVFFWAMNGTVIKVLGKTEKTKVQLFYVMLFSSIIAFPTAFMNWETVPTFSHIDIKIPSGFVNVEELGLKICHIKWIILLALCYFLHVIGHFKAFKYSEMSTIIPLEYTRLVFAGIFGSVLFGEHPHLIKILGYLLIIASGIWLFQSEKKREKKVVIIIEHEE